MIPPKAVGCPIRRSQGPRALASRLSFSQRATSFIASRCQGIHQMPLISNSPTLSPKRALARAQRTDDRGQRTDRTPATGRPSCLLHGCTRSLEPNEDVRSAGTTRPGVLFAYPCPGPAKTERPGLLHGHDSLHDVLRSDDRGQRTDQTVYRALPRSRTRGPDDSRPAAEDGARAICPLPSAFCHLNLVGLGRLERPTSRLSGVRSNQLSYRPVQTTEDRLQTTDRPRLGTSVLWPLSSEPEGMRGRRRVMQTADARRQTTMSVL